MKYIAYGSNMVARQMASRCPGAKMIGIGRLPAARLEFYVHATIERSEIESDFVPVVVWEIDADDEQYLDWYEGYPDYYTKESMTVQMADGSEITGMIYVMQNIMRVWPPYLTYYKDIEDTYKVLGLRSEIETVLKPALKRSFDRSTRKH